MNRIATPLWMRYGECLLAALLLVIIGAITTIFPNTPWGHKIKLANLPTSVHKQRNEYVADFSWPEFQWHPITPDQLHERVLNWLSAPAIKLHSQQKSGRFTQTNADSQNSYSLSLTLPTENLSVLWQTPLLTPTWPGWHITEAKGTQHGDTWNVSIVWQTLPSATASAINYFWHDLDAYKAYPHKKPEFAPHWWQSSEDSSYTGYTNQPPSLTQLLNPVIPADLLLPPAYMVGFMITDQASGVWLQSNHLTLDSTTASTTEATHKPFFLPLNAYWQGWLLEQANSQIFYLSNTQQRWQLNQCQHTNPCLIN